MNELPKYKCHKVVTAAQISWFGRLDQTYELHLDVDGRDEVVKVSADWFEKHNPAAGGYFVLDGGTTYVPQADFERDFARVLPPPPPMPTNTELPAKRVSKPKGEG
jgi:hypothetical protein